MWSAVLWSKPPVREAQKLLGLKQAALLQLGLQSLSATRLMPAFLAWRLADVSAFIDNQRAATYLSSHSQNKLKFNDVSNTKSKLALMLCHLITLEAERSILSYNQEFSQACRKH